MRRTLIVFLLISAWLMALPASAFACRCVCLPNPLPESVERASENVSRTIFEGTVESEWRLGPMRLIFLRDLKGWVGTPGRSILTSRYPLCCSAYLDVGRRYLIDGYVNWFGTVRTNACTLTARIEDAGDVISVLESMSDRARKSP